MSKISKTGTIKISKMSPKDVEILLNSNVNKGYLQVYEMLEVWKCSDLTYIGNIIKKFYKTKKTLNDVVYDYIINNNNLQNIMRNVMYDAIQNNRELFLDDFSNLAKEQNLRISDDAIMGCIIKWYDNLYDMGGLFECVCMGIIQNKITTDDYREQVYNIMKAFTKIPC